MLFALHKCWKGNFKLKQVLKVCGVNKKYNCFKENRMNLVIQGNRDD